jgi:hypothetical protein
MTSMYKQWDPVMSNGLRVPGARPKHRFLSLGVTLIICLVILGMCAGTALAGTSYVDGVSDQNLPAWDGGFTGSYFAGFFQSSWVGSPPSHMTLARYVLQWNETLESSHGANPQGDYRERFEAWLTDVGSLGLIPEVALTSYTGAYPASSAEFRSRLNEVLSSASAQGHPIRYVEGWNEPNNQGHMTEASGTKSPVAAAHYTNEAYALCANTYGCTVIAGNFEDTSTVATYEKTYESALSPTPTIWGVHPYQSVKAHSDSNLNAFEAALPSEGAGDQVWFTEVGAYECEHYDGEERGERKQAEDARYLVNGLMHEPRITPTHVFYYGMLEGNRAYPPCEGSISDTKLFIPSSDPYAPDAPRAAAAFILNGKGSPWAYTGHASSVATPDAALTGSVYPGGFLDTRYHFEYGTTTKYGSFSEERDAGAGFGRAPEASVALAGLTAGTTYHYRLVAWNSEGSDAGVDQTFRTQPAPGATTTEPTELTPTSARLNGFVKPNGLPTTYQFEYGLTTSYELSVPIPAGTAGSGEGEVPVSAVASGLLAATKYHYRVVAGSSAGLGMGSPVTFSTTPLGRPDAVEAGGTIEVYARDPSNDLIETVYESATGKWASYNISGSTGSQIAGNPTVVLAGGTIEVYARSPSNDLIETVYESATNKWGSYNISGSTGSEIAGDPSVIQTSSTIEVYARSPSDDLIETVYEPSTNKWGSYNISGSTGSQIAGNPTVVLAGGTIEVYARSPSNDLIETVYESATNKWGSYNISGSTGSEIAGDPSVIQTSSTIEIYAGNPHSHLIQTLYEPTHNNWASYDITATTGSGLG